MNSDPFSILELNSAIQSASVLRLTLELDAMGAGGLVYPPTYDQGKHIFRTAWIDGEEREVVILDSPQSQANRIELAILDAHHRRDIRYPDIEISVPSPLGEERYSILQLSHRAYDATLLLTQDGDTPFRETPAGKAIYGARLERATGLFEQAPVTLVLGGWDSHSGGGPLSAKIPRAITSEIIGIDAKKAQRGSTKFDPMDIRKDAGPVYKSKDRERMFELDKKNADPKEKKEKRPSEFGLGSVPNLEERGASIRYALQNSLISLPAVRRLRFEDADGRLSPERDAAGRTVVAALGLYGLLSQMESGYFLRSGCDLIARDEPVLEVVGRTLKEVTPYAIDADAARGLLEAALEKASAVGLTWRTDPLHLQADDRLATLVERSRLSTEAEEE